jgi:hypothetical protein
MNQPTRDGLSVLPIPEFDIQCLVDEVNSDLDAICQEQAFYYDTHPENIKFLIFDS